MARKKELKLIHPRVITEALSNYQDDVGYLLTSTQNALSFLNNKALGAEKVRAAITPQMQEAFDRVVRWIQVQPEE